MPDIIASFILRYGFETTLTDMAKGIENASKTFGLTDQHKQKLELIATEIYQVRNKVRE